MTPSRYSQDSIFFYCLLNSCHKLMLMKIFRAVVEFLMSSVFICKCSFLCGLTIHSPLKCFKRQSFKILFFFSLQKSIQYSILLCITIKISNLEPGIQDKIIAISVRNICGRFIAFLSLILYISLLCCRYFVWYFCFSKQTQRSGRGNEVCLAAIFMKVTH